MHGLLLCAGMLATTPLMGQDWQTITQSRRRSGEEHLRVRVAHVAGDLRIRPAEAGQLYRLALRYDETWFDPTVAFSPEAASLWVDVDARNRRGHADWDAEHQSLDLALAPDVPLDMTLRFGAAQASLDLGGLMVRTLSVATGASESRITFDAPNPGVCTHMELQVGAAEFTAMNLGNARCQRVRVQAGVGDLLLDFGGSVPEGFESHVSVHVGLGGVEIRVPDDVGVRLSVRRFLASVSRVGFVQGADGSWFTPNWSDATRRITLDVHAALGGIEVIRVAAARS